MWRQKSIQKILNLVKYFRNKQSILSKSGHIFISRLKLFCQDDSRMNFIRKDPIYQVTKVNESRENINTQTPIISYITFTLLSFLWFVTHNRHIHIWCEDMNKERINNKHILFFVAKKIIVYWVTIFFCFSIRFYYYFLLNLKEKRNSMKRWKRW